MTQAAPMVFSVLAGREVANNSEEWRHECECRWVLGLPTKAARLRYLYGASEVDAKGQVKFWKGIAQVRGGGNEARGMAVADKIKADCMRLHELQQKNPSRPAAGNNRETT